MSKSKVVLVSAARVRSAFAAGEFTAPEAALPSLVGQKTEGRVRGRLNPLAIEAFNAQVKGEAYAGTQSEAEGKRVTLPLTKVTAAGAKVKRPEAFPIAKVRELSGTVGKKGRLSAAHVQAAADAVVAERGWNVKPAKVAKVATAKVPADS